MRGAAMPKSAISAAWVMRSVASSSSGVSARGTSASGMWMVTGTTRSAGAASIITGSGAPERCARNSVWPGKAKPAPVLQRLLVDRVGAERERRAAADQLDAAGDDRDDRGGVRRDPAGRAAPGGAGDGAAPAGPSASPRRPRPARRSARTGNAERARRARAMWPRSPIRKNGSRPRRAAQAFSAISPPMPGRIAEGQRDRRASSLDDEGVAEQFLQIALAEAGDPLGEELLAQRLARLGSSGGGRLGRAGTCRIETSFRIATPARDRDRPGDLPGAEQEHLRCGRPAGSRPAGIGSSTPPCSARARCGCTPARRPRSSRRGRARR